MEKNMKYAYEVYKYRSFSKAAEKNYISQPALSAIIKKLETSLNTQLFDRHTNPISLTPSGEYYIKCIEHIATIENSYKEYFSDLNALKAGSITIGTSTYFCSYTLPDLMEKFSRIYPNIKFFIEENNSTPELKAKLKRGELDLTLSSNSYEVEEFGSQFLDFEAIVLGVPAKAPINERLKEYAISYDEILSDKQLKHAQKSVPISLFRDYDFLTIRKSSDLYARLIAMFEEHGLKVNIIHNLDQMSTCYALAARGFGATVIRASTLEGVKPTSNLCFYKIDSPLAKRTSQFYYKKNAYMPKSVKAFLDFIKEKSATS